MSVVIKVATVFSLHFRLCAKSFLWFDMFVELTALVIAIVGLGVLFSNPDRLASQAFVGLSILILIWLCFVYLGGVSDVKPTLGICYIWNRANAVVAALFPWALWLVKRAIEEPLASRRSILNRSGIWLGFGLLIGALTLLPSFIFYDNITDSRRRGSAYVIYCVAVLIMHGCLLSSTFNEIRKRPGVQGMQLRFFVFYISSSILLAVFFVGIGNIFYFPLLRSSGFVFVIIAYALCAWSSGFARISDFSRISISAGLRIGILFLLGMGGVGLWVGYHRSVATAFDLIVGFLVWGSAMLWLEQRTRNLLDLRSQQSLQKLRFEVVELARTELDLPRLIKRFEDLASRQFGGKYAGLLQNEGDVYVSDKLSILKKEPIFSILLDVGWVTAEGIARRRRNSENQVASKLFCVNRIGLLIAVPRGNPNPSLLVALGTKKNDWPYTYPEVERLQNIAELMDNILIRSRLTEQAALKARMEYLAMMSRGVAHDLKNLITPVSSFLMHAEERFELTDVETEVHAAAGRSVRVMTEYVRESMFFAEQLNPRYEPVDLPGLFNALEKLISARAATRGVTIQTQCDFVGTFVADGILIQRLLVNLLHNAIDASRDAEVAMFATESTRPGCVRLQVVDRGCGIDSIGLTRMFEPYYTTKAFGDEVRGFGLGLAVSQKIVDLHRGHINVQSVVDQGTTITVDMPLAPVIRRGSYVV